MFQNFSWCPTFAKNCEIPKVSFVKVSSFKVINCLENINRINIITINSAILLKKIFDSEPVYNEKVGKINTNLVGKINTNFYGDMLSKGSFQCICLSVVWINSVFKMGRNYYPQVFLEEFKYIVKEEKSDQTYY